MALVTQNFAKFHGYAIDDDAQVNLYKYNALADTEATVEAVGYFNNVYNRLKVNDIIYAVMEGGTAYGLYVVSNISATNVVTITGFATVSAGGVDTAQLADNAVTAAKIAAAVAGDGLAGGGGTALSVNVDGVGIETNADTLRLKDLGVTTAKLALLAVDTGQLAADAVETAKIADDNVTAAKVSNDITRTATVQLTSANFIDMYATPFLLVAAGGANTVHLVHSVAYECDYGTTQFTGGGAVAVQYDSTANGAGTAASATTAAATFNGFAADSLVGADGLLASAASSTAVNKGLYLSNPTGAFATGDSDIYVHVTYSTVATTV